MAFWWLRSCKACRRIQPDCINFLSAKHVFIEPLESESKMCVCQSECWGAAPMALVLTQLVHGLCFFPSLFTAHWLCAAEWGVLHKSLHILFDYVVPCTSIQKWTSSCQLSLSKQHICKNLQVYTSSSPTWMAVKNWSGSCSRDWCSYSMYH